MSLRVGVRALTKKFGDFTAIANVDLNLGPGQIHGLLGENGAGKSTLLKILFGLEPPTEGTVVLGDQPVSWHSTRDAIAHGLGMVEQHFALAEALSVIDNIMLGAEDCRLGGLLRRKEAKARMASLLPSDALKLPWDEPVANLSLGQRQRLEILKLLYRDCKVLFLDEPTAVLTPLEIADFFTVLRALKRQGRTIILITHKVREVLDICDTFSVLRMGKLSARGLVSGTSAEALVEKMIGRKLTAARSRKRAMRPQGGSPRLNVRRLRRPGRSGELTLEVHPGEIVGIAGVDGSGQNFLVDAVMGLQGYEGEVQMLGQTLKPKAAAAVRCLAVGAVPEVRSSQGLWMSESCTANLSLGLEKQFYPYGIQNTFAQRAATTVWAEEFDVRGAHLGVDVCQLSGGNQQKILFAREVAGRKPDLLICQQPTRGMDLGATAKLHQKLIELRDEGVGQLIVSGDLDELFTLCDRIYVFYNFKVGGEFVRGSFCELKIGAAMTGVSFAV